MNKENKMTIELDDSFRPTFIKIKSGDQAIHFEVGNVNKDDNAGGGGRITLFEGEKQITMFIPKSAVLSIREVFWNGYRI